MAFHPYPTDPAFGDCVVLIQEGLRDRMVNPKETFHAAWHLIGYAGGQWDVHNPPVGAVADAPAMTKAEAADALEQFKGVGAVGDSAATAFPWQVLVPMLLNLAAEALKKWLNK